MALLGWVFFGFVLGLIARSIMPVRDPLGLIGTTALGVAGALVAGLLGRALRLYATNELGGLIAAMIGSFIVLGVYAAVINMRENPEDRSQAA